jgi:hypothetical protein
MMEGDRQPLLLTVRLSLVRAHYPLFTIFYLLIGLGLFPARATEREGRWAIILAGVSGDPDLQKRYLQEILDLRSVLEETLGFPPNQIAALIDDPSKSQGLIQYKATRENLQEVCRNFASRVKKDDLVFVFIEGHGDYDGKIYRLNLVGPDPTGEELAAMLYSIPVQRFIVMNATNCSGGSLPALSQQGKIVITATKSGMEKNLTHLGPFLIEAFKNNAADSDKTGRVSILEAFSYASRKVEDYYESEGNLQTEHPGLDDNGDAQAQSKPAPENGEGLLARTTFLDAGAPAAAKSGMTSEQQALALEAQDLEKQIEALKYAKGKMQEAEYETKLEELLLKLARVNARLRGK